MEEVGGTAVLMLGGSCCCCIEGEANVGVRGTGPGSSTSRSGGGGEYALVRSPLVGLPAETPAARLPSELANDDDDLECGRCTPSRLARRELRSLRDPPVEPAEVDFCG